MFMYGFQTVKPRHVNESSCRTKQRLHWQKFYSSVYIKKIKNFFMFFCFFLAKVISPNAKENVKTLSISCFCKKQFKKFEI